MNGENHYLRKKTLPERSKRGGSVKFCQKIPLQLGKCSFCFLNHDSQKCAYAFRAKEAILFPLIPYFPYMQTTPKGIKQSGTRMERKKFLL